ncbi:RAB11-binding protein RELCH homolog [Prorops nasuta]|uniref:RAB11-binding protein RELCH homolog n=1 Tax=Prorops nasuta TaxID=863751 RepID=UPI0034CE3616
MASLTDPFKEPPSSYNKGINITPRTHVTYDDIAAKLFSDKLLSTANELYTELGEAAKEIPSFKEYFTTPSNAEINRPTAIITKPESVTSMARSSSQATLDSLDMTRYSEDGATTDDRVAILEFELRKARENISALRANLTLVTESEGRKQDKPSDKQFDDDSPIKPHEQRALNFLVNEYLLARSYKLTSITFSDENDNQDFEDWDDVGLNIPKPAALLQIYREYMKSYGYEKPPSTTCAIQTDSFGICNEITKEQYAQKIEEISQLESKILTLDKEKTNLRELLTAASENLQMKNNAEFTAADSNSTTSEKFDFVESPSRETKSNPQGNHDDNDDDDDDDENCASIAFSLGETDPGDKEWTQLQIPQIRCIDTSDSSSAIFINSSSSRYLPSKFKTEAMARCSVNVSDSIISNAEERMIRKEDSGDALLRILTKSLLKIVPNLSSNREDIILLILTAVRFHSDPAEKESLLQLLFSCKKRPSEQERKIVLAGLIALSRQEDVSLDVEEIMTVCWEQSQHKYPEKRLLAVECCSALAPYAPANIRNSLMLSMLQQILLEDKDSNVRIAVVKSIALQVLLMNDSDKYFQCEELSLTALRDPSPEVVQTTTDILLPILAQWALSLGRLQSHLLPRVISNLKSHLKPTQHFVHKDYIDETRIVPSIKVLQYLLPYTIVCVAQADYVKQYIRHVIDAEIPKEFLDICHSELNDPSFFYEGDVDISTLLQSFFSNSWHEKDSWPEIDWVTNKLLPDVLEIIKSVEMGQDGVLNALNTFIRSLCLGFGHNIFCTKIQPIFVSEMAKLEREFTSFSTDKNIGNLTLIPAYLIVQSTWNAPDVAKYFKQLHVMLSVARVDISSLRVATIALCAQSSMEEHVLSGLWEGVSHPECSVRCTTAELFGSVIIHVSDQLVDNRILPAITTLASDPDISVRGAAIVALGRVITECKLRNVRDKARMTLETITREPQGVPSALASTLVSTLASIAPNCPQNYIEDVIATQLTGITASALQQSRKSELVNTLVDAYSILVYCPLRGRCISQVLLPGLKYLEILVNQNSPQLKETVRSFIREAESRQDASKSIERSTSVSSGLTLPSVNVGQGVEDMRQRMSKMFQQKTNSSGMFSIFTQMSKK